MSITILSTATRFYRADARSRLTNLKENDRVTQGRLVRSEEVAEAVGTGQSIVVAGGKLM